MTSSDIISTPVDAGEQYPGYGLPVGPELPIPDFTSMVIDLIPSTPSSAPYNNPNPGDIVGRQPASLL